MKTKEKVLSLAISLFAKKGYNGVSIRELSTATNLSVAGIYHYFPDKQCFSNKAFSFSSIWQSDVPPKDKLRLFVHSLLKVMLDDKDFHNLLQHELLLADEVRLKLLADNIFRDEFNDGSPLHFTVLSVLIKAT